jgi:hypothetical protein
MPVPMPVPKYQHPELPGSPSTSPASPQYASNLLNVELLLMKSDTKLMHQVLDDHDAMRLSLSQLHLLLCASPLSRCAADGV